MKKIKITNREINFFFLGFFVMLLIEMIYDWQEVKRSFMEGYNEVTIENNE